MEKNNPYKNTQKSSFFLLFREPIPFLISITSIASSVIITLLMITNIKFNYDFSDLDNYKNFLSTFELPIFILKSGFALVGFYIVIVKLMQSHQMSLLSQEQFDLAREQYEINLKNNISSQYLEHRKYIKEVLHDSKCEIIEYKSTYKITDVFFNFPSIYASFFPNNSIEHLSYKADISSLQSLVIRTNANIQAIDKNSENEYLKLLETISVDLKSLGVTISTNDRIRFYTHFNPSGEYAFVVGEGFRETLICYESIMATLASFLDPKTPFYEYQKQLSFNLEEIEFNIDKINEQFKKVIL